MRLINDKKPDNKLKVLLEKGNKIEIGDMMWFKGKNKYHSGKIEGEDLPENVKDMVNLPLLLLGTVLGLFANLTVNYLINFLQLS